MRIGVEDAKRYFQDVSQQKASMITPETLPDEPYEYWAQGGICGIFHPDHWPGVWMAHYGVDPDMWGHVTEPAKAILNEFWAARSPELIIGWTDSTNRAAISFAKRIGFFETGTMQVGDVQIIMTGWRP